MSDNWIETWTGVAFDLEKPRPEDVRIEDIAHALSRQCRFGGGVREFYSVAQHSVFVSRLCDPAHAVGGLMLPIDPDRGYPVPWFVAWVNGKPDFRVIGVGKR